MKLFRNIQRRRSGHTLMELVVAMAASTFLLAGMGSVMYIGREIAYTPSDASRRAQAADVVGQICDELRYATLVIQQTPQILEFVVADRNADGTAEKIRYEWSGVAGAPLRKTINGGTAVDILSSVNAFTITLQQSQKTTTLTTTTDSAEAVLLANTAVSSVSYRDIDDSDHMAQVINPAGFPSVPTNAVAWNLTKIDFYGQQSGTVGQTLTVQIRQTGDPYDQPTSNVLGQATIAESAIVNGWNTVTFASPIRGLQFNRKNDMVFVQTDVGGSAARIAYNNNLETGINDSTDGGASWRYMTSRQMWGRIYGTYSTPSTSYNINRNYVSTVRIALQSGGQGYARIDASAPLRNLPELATLHWRTDFGRDDRDNDHPPQAQDDPTTTDTNSDGVADWATTGGGTFDRTKLRKGIWTATGAIETRPLADFTTTTSVEVRCRNTTVGGNGAVCRIYADRQGGQYAPILVYLQRQSDDSQTLTLSGKTSDSLTKSLFNRTKLSGDFVRYKLTILPNNNLVNLQINGEDQGTFTYPTYVPSTTNDRYLTLTTDTSASEFDYVDVRVATN